MRPKSIQYAASVALVTLFVSGCDVGDDAESRAPIAIRFTGPDEMVFALCKSFRPQQITAAYAPAPGEWTSFLELEGDLEGGVGVPVDQAALDASFVGPSSTPDFATGGAVSVLVKGPEPHNAVFGVFLLDENFDDGRWIRDDETRADEPCGS